MILRLVTAFLAFAALFLLFPGIDLWIARLFYDGEEFPLAGSDALEGLRHAIWSASIVTALAGLALWLIWLPLGRRASVPGRLWGWVALVFVVGPGLLVNVLLKEHWGRARPVHVFDGEAAFTRPLLIARECDRNCSFVSGEAAGAVALAIVLGALLWPWLRGRARWPAVAALVAVATLAAAMRVLTGRHFLSDVIFAAFLTTFVALALWRLMRIGPARDALSLPALRADLRALVQAARRGWRRLVG